MAWVEAWPAPAEKYALELEDEVNTLRAQLKVMQNDRDVAREAFKVAKKTAEEQLHETENIRDQRDTVVREMGFLSEKLIAERDFWKKEAEFYKKWIEGLGSTVAKVLGNGN